MNSINRAVAFLSLLALHAAALITPANHQTIQFHFSFKPINAVFVRIPEQSNGSIDRRAWFEIDPNEIYSIHVLGDSFNVNLLNRTSSFNSISFRQHSGEVGFIDSTGDLSYATMTNDEAKLRTQQLWKILHDGNFPDYGRVSKSPIGDVTEVVNERPPITSILRRFVNRHHLMPAKAPLNELVACELLNICKDIPTTSGINCDDDEDDEDCDDVAPERKYFFLNITDNIDMGVFAIFEMDKDDGEDVASEIAKGSCDWLSDDLQGSDQDADMEYARIIAGTTTYTVPRGLLKSLWRRVVNSRRFGKPAARSLDLGGPQIYGCEVPPGRSLSEQMTSVLTMDKSDFVTLPRFADPWTVTTNSYQSNDDDDYEDHEVCEDEQSGDDEQSSSDDALVASGSEGSDVYDRVDSSLEDELPTAAFQECDPSSRDLCESPPSGVDATRTLQFHSRNKQLVGLVANIQEGARSFGEPWYDVVPEDISSMRVYLAEPIYNGFRGGAQQQTFYGMTVDTAGQVGFMDDHGLNYYSSRKLSPKVATSWIAKYWDVVNDVDFPRRGKSWNESLGFTQIYKERESLSSYLRRFVTRNSLQPTTRPLKQLISCEVNNICAIIAAEGKDDTTEKQVDENEVRGSFFVFMTEGETGLFSMVKTDDDDDEIKQAISGGECDALPDELPDHEYDEQIANSWIVVDNHTYELPRSAMKKLWKRIVRTRRFGEPSAHSLNVGGTDVYGCEVPPVADFAAQLHSEAVSLVSEFISLVN